MKKKNKIFYENTNICDFLNSIVFSKYCFSIFKIWDCSGFCRYLQSSHLINCKHFLEFLTIKNISLYKICKNNSKFCAPRMQIYHEWMVMPFWLGDVCPLSTLGSQTLTTTTFNFVEGQKSFCHMSVDQSTMEQGSNVVKFSKSWLK
jgi:hypothetical protein